MTQHVKPNDIANSIKIGLQYFILNWSFPSFEDNI